MTRQTLSIVGWALADLLTRVCLAGAAGTLTAVFWFGVLSVAGYVAAGPSGVEVAAQTAPLLGGAIAVGVFLTGEIPD